MKADKIYLIGFMASGKSTVARELGRRLDWRVEDVDELIEARERMTVADIFARRGEPYFRACEREMVKVLLPLRNAVVATGGGTFLDPDSRTAIQLDGVSVWLDVPLEALLYRLPTDGRRPLASNREHFEQLFLARREAYQQAHIRIDAGCGRPEEIAERILDALAG